MGYPRSYPISGFPADQKTVRLVYEDYDVPAISLTTAQAVNWNTYNINSAYDPNDAFASGALPGFNEYAAVYANYRVTWCKISTTFTQALGNPACYVGIYMRPIIGETGFTTWRDWIEIAANPQPNAREILGNANGNESTKTLMVKSSLGKLIGQPMMLASDTAYQASVVSNPAQKLQAFVFIATMDGFGPVATLSVYVRVRITYYVTFWNRRTVKG